MKRADSDKKILILGIMAFWCNGDNYAAAPLLVEIARDLHLDISQAPVLLSLSLLGFGLGFIMIQPTLVGTAQQLMPKRRGTVMSVASFCMFTGGGLGNYLNGQILSGWGFEAVFIFAAVLILLAGTFAAILLQKMAPAAAPSAAGPGQKTSLGGLHGAIQSGFLNSYGQGALSLC